MSEQLIEITGRWLATGQISDDEKNLMKSQYLIDIGAVGCKTCGNVWSDIKHHFEYKLKQLNLTPVAKVIRKFLIIGTSFLQLPGQSVVIVNEGQDSEDRKVLTDEMAKQILADYPDYNQLIGINPAWQARQDALAEGQEPEDETGNETETDDQVEDKSDAKLADLQAAHDTLAEENKKIKEDNRVLKGQLTRTTNELAKLKTLATADPAVPANPAPAVTDPAATGKVDVSGGESSTTSTGGSESAESKGTQAGNAANEVIQQSQA